MDDHFSREMSIKGKKRSRSNYILHQIDSLHAMSYFFNFFGFLRLHPGLVEGFFHVSITWSQCLPPSHFCGGPLSIDGFFWLFSSSDYYHATVNLVEQQGCNCCCYCFLYANIFWVENTACYFPQLCVCHQLLRFDNQITIG